MSSAADTTSVVPAAIHRITTVHAGARRSHRALAACPRRDGAVDLDVCGSCPHARGFLGGQDASSRQVLCAVERTAPVTTAPGTVGSVMRRDVVCVHPEMDVDAMALLFIERSIGGVPVVDDNNHPLGMVSKTDLVSMYARRHAGTGMLEGFDPDSPLELPPVAARELMSSVVFTLRENQSLARAAELFAAEKLHRAPVVDASGAVVGVLTSFDIVRALAGESAQRADSPAANFRRVP